MSLLLNEEQSMLRDSARSFMAEQAPVSQLRALRDANDETGFSREVWARFAELGFTGVLIPEAQGGLGLGFVEAGTILEEIGRNLTASPFLASSVVAATALIRAGNPAQQAEWLPKLASGAVIATLALEEHGKHALDRIAMKARREGEGFVLDGHKTFVIDGHVADLLIVVARVGTAGLTMFLVPRSAPGVQLERVVMVDSRPTARVRLEGVKVAAAAVLGPVDGADAALNVALDAGRAAAAAELLGLTDEVFVRTTDYLKARKQFGKLIGEFQALQHRAADLYCDIELARAAVMGALQALDADPAQAMREVAVAKSRAGLSATRAVQEGVQMHGGMGMTDAFDIGLFMKRARMLQEYLGDAAHHADRLARQRGY
ncbi:MAG: acyl-CoA dehydrogenase family protein [Burkholderiales bacterium]|jgi:alkylation response protein AidB-like acyl-CoA dehydrogenase